MKFLFLVMSLMLSSQAHARLLLGDWESYGDAPIEPNKPSYSFKYDCQIELSDSVEHTKKNSQYKIFAVAKFYFNNEKTFVPSEELQFTWLKVNQDFEETVLENSKSFFSLKNHFFRLSIQKGTEAKSDLVILGSELNLPVGGFLVPHSSADTNSREGKTLINRNEIFAQAKEGKNSLFLKSYLQCEKIK